MRHGIENESDDGFSILLPIDAALASLLTNRINLRKFCVFGNSLKVGTLAPDVTIKIKYF